MDNHVSVAYRRKAIPYSWNQRLVRPQQQKIYDLYSRLFLPSRIQRVLDLGVNGSLESADEYFFEVNYPYKERIVAVGLENAGLFHRFYPESTYVQTERGRSLPFADWEFDVVFCNAVIEHVGSRSEQANFLREVLRVGRNVFLTTPNRWFPIEMHTILPLVHFLPTNLYRRLFTMLGFGFFAQEQNLNLLDSRALAKLVPEGIACKIYRHRVFGICSNVILVVTR